MLGTIQTASETRRDETMGAMRMLGLDLRQYKVGALPLTKPSQVEEGEGTSGDPFSTDLC